MADEKTFQRKTDNVGTGFFGISGTYIAFPSQRIQSRLGPVIYKISLS